MHAILRFLGNLSLSVLCAAAMAAAVGGVAQSWQTLATLQAELASQSAAAAPVPSGPAKPCSEDVRCLTARAVQLHAEGVAALELSRMHAGR